MEAERIIFAFFILIIVASIVALIIAGGAAAATNSMATNARRFTDLGNFAKLKATEGVSKEAILNAYLKAQGVTRITHTDDMSSFPPHPSIDSLSGLVNPTNPWKLPGETNFRPGIQPSSVTTEAEKVGAHILAEYVSALVGRGVSSKIIALKKRIAGSGLERLFGLLFEEDAPKLERITHIAAKHSKQSPHQHLGGHCSDPIKVRDGGENCVAVCGTENARHIRPPFVLGNKFIGINPDHPNESYCWSGPAPPNLPTTPLGASASDHRRCSQTTGRLVLTDDGGWQCRPMFPHLFGGTDGTVKKACKFSPSEHAGDRQVFELAVDYVDLLSGRRVPNHFAFASQTSYSRALAKAPTPEAFMKMAADTEFFFDRPVVCDCDAVRDVLDNPFLSKDTAAKLKFYGLYRCVSNPCAMTKLAEGVSTFSPLDGTCHPGPQAPQGTVNVILGEKRSPIAGVTPAMGLRLADYSTRVDSHTRVQTKSYDERGAKELTRLASPVIPALNLDDTNPSRHVLYVPTQKMVMIGARIAATARPSSVLHTECLPSPLNGRWGVEPPDPFSTAAFYIEPVADVLAGAVPQKPYEHDLLAIEALRNSRLVSGNILGGSEILYSTLLATNRPDVDIEPKVDSEDPGEVRLARIRRYYNTMMTKRRLSTYEHLRLNLMDDGGDQSNKVKYSPWDTKFRAGDVSNYSGIRNLAETFAIREGLLLRSYGAFGGWVVTGDSKRYDFSSLEGNDTTKSKLQLFNPAQMAFPTNLRTVDQSFHIDRRVLFDTRPYAAHFEPNLNKNPPSLFSDSGPNSDYRLSVDSKAWGVNSFRFLPNFKSNVFSKLDKRISYDAKNVKIGGYSLPLDLFKKSLIEWGHPNGDIDRGHWLRPNVDTSRAYHNFLLELSEVVRPIWFTAAWETLNYHYKDTEADHET